MTQPMDMGTMMQGYMIGATIRTACAMMLELMFTIIPRENTPEGNPETRADQ